jgi:5-(aminomethyl)-3-furanmethanol phosphate kinase
MALLAMDQYALVLAGATPRAEPVASFAAARRAAAAGRLPVLFAARVLEEESRAVGARSDRSRGGRSRGGPAIERTFRTTSDAIAAWVAGRLEARHLLLLKSVPGIDRAIGGRRDAARAARGGLVDERFAHHLPRAARVRIVDGGAADLEAELSRWLGACAPPRKSPRGELARAPGRVARGARRSTRRRGPR